jgi:hypothetical protein
MEIKTVPIIHSIYKGAFQSLALTFPILLGSLKEIGVLTAVIIKHTEIVMD